MKDNITENIRQSFIFILKNFTLKLEQLVQVYSITLSTKMDAIKENYIQASRILLYACSLYEEGEI